MRETAFYPQPGAATRPAATRAGGLRRWLLPLGVVMLLLALWQVVVLLRIYPPFIIPAPADVAARFGQVLADGRLLLHTSTTLSAVLAGLVIGAGAGLALGYVLARSRLLDSLLSPVIVSLQSTPVVAYAPLLVIWFGSGLTSKVVTSALIVFFPVLLNTIVGVRGVPQPFYDLMRVHRATRWQIFAKLEVPAAMPMLLGGLKIGATLAVIGAVVGEFVSANAGLGFLINLARSQYDTPLVFVAVFTLAALARLLYALVALLERRLLHWQARARRS